MVPDQQAEAQVQIKHRTGAVWDQPAGTLPGRTKIFGGSTKSGSVCTYDGAGP